MSSPARPFADAVLAYAQAGWPAIMPVPIEKSPPPTGFTGAEGRDTDPMQLVHWSSSHATSSIALRMPDGVIGIDVDQYSKNGLAKHGLDSLAAAIERWGPLPFTWSSTARYATPAAGPGGSRIMFFRVPPGRYVTKLDGGDVEVIQRHHRYAVVWPSPHPDVGQLYRWFDPTGHVADAPPKPNEFPELPETWVTGLREGATDAGPAAASRDAGQALLDQLLADERPACAEITSAALQAAAELSKVDAGSRHDTATARVHQLVQLAAGGHPGLGRAVPELVALWQALTAGEERGEEWARMLLTSARKAVSVVGGRQVGNDPCLFTGGLEIAAPAPADDRPDAPSVEPIEVPRELHPLEVIGTEPFTTRAKLDQKLAEAVLERMYPVLRFGYDTGAWVVRGRTHWETQGELAEWAVSTVAGIMPRGDASAEKGSDAHTQAELRTRFMTAAKSAGIAKKMRSVVARGSHPCALRVAELDSEPWLLWAGGVGWDLAASRHEPTAALIDPTTPHLRSAGVSPELRPTPLWDTFTAAVWPDPELRAWALRVLSIAVTGYSDKALPIMIGERDRGKTQIVVLLMSVLGSYAHAADPRLLGGADKAHASIVYALKGRRLSFIDEGPRDGRLGQERLKQLTGGGDLTANEMNRNPITFTPTHTLVLTANDEPLLTDPAVRGRVRLIPCEGVREEVRAARAAIGHVSGPAWRREAPGVLAMLMAEAAAWLADQDSALTAAAPEAYRNRAELIANDQNPVLTWLDEETETHPDGARSRELYEGFVGWCKNGNTHPSRIPSETKWGREVTQSGYPIEKRRDGHYRQLHIKARGPWIGAGLTPKGAGFVQGEGFASQPCTTPVNVEETTNSVQGVQGVQGSNTSYVHAQAHARVHEAPVAPTMQPCNPAQPETVQPAAHSAQPASRLQQAAAEAKLAAAHVEHQERRAGLSDPATRAERREQNKAVNAEREAEFAAGREVKAEARAAAAKAAEKAAALQARITEAAGELVQLPAVVTRDGAVRHIANDHVAIAELFAALGVFEAMIVDVETSGYPIGHADYALRTIQLGNAQAAVVFDAGDLEQLSTAGALLATARTLHAHSATADLVPLAVAGALSDIDEAWDRMHDTVLPAKLADPQSTGSDPGLKQLAAAVLGEHATAPGADADRAALFKAGKWLTDTKVTTARERSGWAQVDSRCTTMIRYAASDVLDTAALVSALPAVSPAVLHRERIAQQMTARVAHRGLRIDGEHVAELLPRHRDALTAAGDRLREFGIDNPGSDQQVAAALLGLGAPLPTTRTGRASVAKGVLDPFKTAQGPVGELVRARLDYQHHETALGLFLEPYHQLVTRGDGRARPTVYTLGADTGRMSCLQSDALIEMPRDLAQHPNGVPITKVKAGDMVYAFDHHRELVLRRVKWCAQTGVRETLTITAENRDGHRLTLRATPEHLIRLYDGDWRATEGLMHRPGRPHREDGPRLMTMVRRRVDDGYVKFFPHGNAKGGGPNGGGRVREHRFVAAVAEGHQVHAKHDVNHIDGNRANNHPSNLQVMTREAHRGNRDLAWGVDQPALDLPIGSNEYRVISVTPGLVESVWDMEVEDVHNFIANGICVHNCVRPNLQQVPRRGGMRACITADPGQLLVSADFASVEIRVAAALSGDPQLRHMIEHGIDLHWQIARQVFGPEASKEDRYNVKRGVFGRLYGSGIPGIARTLGISESVAASVVDTLDGMTPTLAAWTAGLKRSVQQGNTKFEAYSGRVIHLDPRLPHKALNYCVQGTARELLVDTLIRLADTRWAGATLLPVHDEILLAVPEAEAVEAGAALIAAMETELHGVRIAAESSEPSFAWRDAS